MEVVGKRRKTKAWLRTSTVAVNHEVFQTKTEKGEKREMPRNEDREFQDTVRPSTFVENRRWLHQFRAGVPFCPESAANVGGKYRSSGRASQLANPGMQSLADVFSYVKLLKV